MTTERARLALEACLFRVRQHLYGEPLSPELEAQVQLAEAHTSGVPDGLESFGFDDEDFRARVLERFPLASREMRAVLVYAAGRPEFQALPPDMRLEPCIDFAHAFLTNPDPSVLSPLIGTPAEPLILRMRALRACIETLETVS